MKTTTNFNTCDGQPEGTTFNLWHNGRLTGLGSFHCALFDAYVKASGPNRERLRKAFADLFTLSDEPEETKLRYFVFDSYAINDLKKGVPAKEIVKNYGYGTIALGIIHPEDEHSASYCMKQAIEAGTFLEISKADYLAFLNK